MNETKTQVKTVAKVATAANTGIMPQQKQSVLAVMANRLSIEPTKLMDVLKKTAFSTCRTNEEFISMCVVANKYGLDPITKEIYAFPNKSGAVIPVVGYDGWVKLCNSNPAFDGVEFAEAEDGSWCECRIYRKDRTHPIATTEWLVECDMGTMPWKKYPRRMLRNKAFNQCARLAFGFAGIYDPDEAERIAACTTSENIVTTAPTGVKTRPMGNRMKSPGVIALQNAIKMPQNASERVMSSVDTQTAPNASTGDFEGLESEEGYINPSESDIEVENYEIEGGM